MAERVPVLVSVLAAETEGDEEPMRMRMPGTVECQGADTVIRYTEHLAGDEGTVMERTEVTLRARDGHAVMQRKGAFGAMMVFEPGQWRESVYHTPYGDLPMSVRARTVTCGQTGAGGEIRLDYDLTVQGSPLSRRVFDLSWQVCAPC